MAGILIAVVVVVLVVAVTMAVRANTEPDGDSVPFDPVRPDPEPVPED